ncbi:hypothetical protein M422DRAFT_257450 [Sphaerobolus stellatus SS14]|uniref:Uncharacterized protein n=1 Tax=Sphaerobolus stellatus (strain SS14) TaxID=990650 RepID=A0A0C9VPR4_SPHS4|nr:hypothetical protein M422DRAFT_262051 [Sphaerobolus stellatus SS14]KIJ39846.1 hypothetical protein M422DRAFT_257450 [Sphaerobolus stellatus SS14]
MVVNDEVPWLMGRKGNPPATNLARYTPLMGRSLPCLQGRHSTRISAFNLREYVEFGKDSF